MHACLDRFIDLVTYITYTCSFSVYSAMKGISSWVSELELFKNPIIDFINQEISAERE
jgi:hypothetical protein